MVSSKIKDRLRLSPKIKKAIVEGNTKKALELFERQILRKAPNDSDPCDEEGWTALHWAVAEGNLGLVKGLWESGKIHCIDSKSQAKKTPFYFAVLRGHREIAEYLLTQGAKIDEPNNRGQSVLHQAAQKNFIISSMLKPLLDWGASVNVFDAFGSTPLSISAENGWLEGARLLLKAGANPNLSSPSTELSEAEPQLSIHKYPIFSAIYYGDLAMTKLLVKSGAKFQVFDSQGLNPLHAAVYYNKEDIVKYLIIQGINVNVKSKDLSMIKGLRGKTALEIAEHYENTKIAEAIKEAIREAIQEKKKKEVIRALSKDLELPPFSN